MVSDRIKCTSRFELGDFGVAPWLHTFPSGNFNSKRQTINMLLNQQRTVSRVESII